MEKIVVVRFPFVGYIYKIEIITIITMCSLDIKKNEPFQIYCMVSNHKENSFSA